jgi:hypothetical protein
MQNSDFSFSEVQLFIYLFNLNECGMFPSCFPGVFSSYVIVLFRGAFAVAVANVCPASATLIYSHKKSPDEYQRTEQMSQGRRVQGQAHLVYRYFRSNFIILSFVLSKRMRESFAT